MTGVLIAVLQLNELRPLLVGFDRLGHRSDDFPLALRGLLGEGAALSSPHGPPM